MEQGSDRDSTSEVSGERGRQSGAGTTLPSLRRLLMFREGKHHHSLPSSDLLLLEPPVPTIPARCPEDLRTWVATDLSTNGVCSVSTPCDKDTRHWEGKPQPRGAEGPQPV